MSNHYIVLYTWNWKKKCSVTKNAVELDLQNKEDGHILQCDKQKLTRANDQ